MKFLHLGDLHIGKRLNNISLLEDQRYILGQILDIAREERPDAVLIAGDVYDRTLPPAEAVTLLDDFLTALAGEKIPVFLISGNHDSAERLAFGGRLLSEGGVYLSPVYDGELTPHLLEDEYGTVAVWLLPFIRPAHVRAVYPMRRSPPIPRRSRRRWHRLPLRRTVRYWWRISLSPGRRRAVLRNLPWAAWKMWMLRYLMPSTMWRWGISTDRRKWGM